MIVFLARRLVSAILLVFVVSSAAFVLARIAPGDFATQAYGFGARPETLARARAEANLDQHPVRQYVAWLGRLARFDPGTSLVYRRPVGPLVRERAANTLILGGAALLLAFGLGVPLGVVAGSRRGSAAARIVAGVSVVAVSIPPLVTSLVLVLLAARTGLLPIGGMTSLAASHASTWAWFVDVLWHLPVPAIALALPLAATLERVQARAMADALAQPAVAAAAARGVPASRRVWRHAWPLALQPVVAIGGLMAGTILSGAFAVEMVTAWPGLGRLLYDALRARDLYLVGGCAAAGAVFLAAGSLAADLLQAALDPRARDTGEAAA